MAESNRNRRRILATSWPALAGIGAVAGGIWWFYAVQGSADVGDKVTVPELVDRYCVECHNGIDYAGSLRLDDRDLAAIRDDADVWEKVVRKLKTGMMPPAGEPRPSRERADALIATLENTLDAATAPTPGPALIRRLNRAEYANAIRDLLALEIDAATLLPLDDSSEGFDNIAAALGTSPSLIESYVAAAMKISRWAIGDRTAPRTQAIYTVPPDLRQDRHLDGLPLGTRGGFRVDHLFPLDAEYEIAVRRSFRSGGAVDLTIDGRPVEVDERGRARLTVAAGPRALSAALVDTRRASGVDDIYSAPAPSAGIQSIEIDGPFDARGVGETPSRRRILACAPTVPAEESACAAEIINALAARAFRRPLAPDELPALLHFFEQGRIDGSFEDGIQNAVARILVDPRFLYRIETDRPGLAAGSAYEIGDYELATRLSFFLWSSIPDDTLFDVAASGRLHEPEMLEGEVARMLADPKADALIENFAAQWLFLRELESVTPDAESFDDNLRRAMANESQRLFAAIMHEDLSILRLLDADFTFVNDRLAEHYGYDGVRGSHFRRIGIPPESPRRGLLGHASILTVTSVTNRTSPVIRGSWILETLLGSPAPVPPPDVETTLEGDDGEQIALTVRERLEAHRANPTCASCHAIMDPFGLTLENFDLVGAWRDADAGRPIDTQATLADGTAIDGPAALRRALLDRSEAFVSAATEKLMTYALGRRIEHYDMPTIRAIVREAAEDDYRFSALVGGIVRSVPFRTRANGGAPVVGGNE